MPTPKDPDGRGHDLDDLAELVAAELERQATEPDE